MKHIIKLWPLLAALVLLAGCAGISGRMLTDVCRNSFDLGTSQAAWQIKFTNELGNSKTMIVMESAGIPVDPLAVYKDGSWVGGFGYTVVHGQFCVGGGRIRNVKYLPVDVLAAQPTNDGRFEIAVQDGDLLWATDEDGVLLVSLRGQDFLSQTELKRELVLGGEVNAYRFWAGNASFNLFFGIDKKWTVVMDYPFTVERITIQ